MGYNIAVLGSSFGNIEKETLEKSYETGALVAEKGNTVITGGCTGIPHEAAKGAQDKGGNVVAFSPARNLDEHKRIGYPSECFSEIIFAQEDCGNLEIRKKYRTVSLVDASSAVIIIGGRIGTLNEFTIAYDTGKTIGILKGTGGTADLIPAITKGLNKKTDSKIIYSEKPEILVTDILKVLLTQTPA